MRFSAQVHENSNLQKLLKKYCQNGCEYKNLEDCCRILDNRRKPVTKGNRTVGKYPYYGANGIQDYVSDFIFDGTFVLVGEDGSVMTANFTPVVTWAEGKIWVNNHAHIVEETSGVMLRYLFHYLQTINIKNFVHGNIPKLNQGDFRTLKIPIPPIPIQEEIVRILDKFTNLTAQLEAELEAELEARKKQYEFYRDRLLSFGKEIERRKISEVFARLRGTPITATIMKQISIDDGDICIFAGGKTVIKTKEDMIKNANITRVPAILVQSRGIIDFIFYDKPFTFKNEMWAYTCNNRVTLKFLYYYLKNNVSYFREKSIGMGSLPQISLPITEDFIIPLPPLKTQEKIVSILDKFSTLCTDLTSGIPAEIEARKKQYEYYRDKLLTFDKIN